MNKRRFWYIFGKVLCVFVVLFLLFYYIIFSYLCYSSEQREKTEITQLVNEWQDNIDYRDEFVSNDETAYTNNISDNDGIDADAHNNSDIEIENDQEASEDKLSEKNTKQEENTETAYDCILVIPSIELNKYVYTGKKREEFLEQYDLITSAQDMRFKNGGNYIICGHYSRLYGHSLNRLKEIQIGDEAIVWYKEKKYIYKVTSVFYINMKETTQYCNQTNQPELTIISCAKFEGNNKYIVVKCRYIQ